MSSVYSNDEQNELSLTKREVKLAAKLLITNLIIQGGAGESSKYIGSDAEQSLIDEVRNLALKMVEGLDMDTNIADFDTCMIRAKEYYKTKKQPSKERKKC